MKDLTLFLITGRCTSLTVQ